MRVADEDEAVRLANDSHLGLLAYVFTRDRDKGKRLAERIEAGTVMVNDVLNTYACPETPWGGVKASGIGRTHSVHGLRDLCETRHVNYDRIALPREVWWYPYKERTFRALSAARSCCSESGRGSAAEPSRLAADREAVEREGVAADLAVVDLEQLRAAERAPLRGRELVHEERALVVAVGGEEGQAGDRLGEAGEALHVAGLVGGVAERSVEDDVVGDVRGGGGEVVLGPRARERERDVERWRGGHAQPYRPR